MHPVLRFFRSAFIAILVYHPLATATRAQAPATLLSTPVSSLRFASDQIADPSVEELKSFGPRGGIIEEARAEVIFILAGESSCSAWFRVAEPQAVEKFRSLRFAVDLGGRSEILKLDAWEARSVFYQPYVAHAGQNVGWGSTITVNANGAFFKDWAPVRIVTDPHDKGYLKEFKRLVVSNFDGATREARVLTLLHELGHVLDMLPVDAGVPSGPELSTSNTALVLRHCGAQIREVAKHSLTVDSAFLPWESPVAIEEERVRRKASKQ